MALAALHPGSLTQSPVKAAAATSSSNSSDASSSEYWLGSHAQPPSSVQPEWGAQGHHDAQHHARGVPAGVGPCCQLTAVPCETSSPTSAEPDSSEPPAIVKDLGVSFDSLQRLLTGDCPVESQQPVWMVVNLQGKIKGSYTARKMMEFSRRGTLSSAQMVLGIDKDLPYVSRQELGYYRRIDHVLRGVHSGAAYIPLAEEVVSRMRQLGQTPQEWQPLRFDATAAHGSSSQQSSTAHGATADVSSSADSSSDGSSSCADSHAAAVAADAQLQLALQRLCGTAALAAADEVQSSAAAPTSDSPGLSRASSASYAAAAAQQPDGPTPSAGEVAAGSPAASASLESCSVEGGGPEPVWLYINHLGWCRGPFPGDKMIQAHLCGRLPRDTLVVCHNPDLPCNLLCSDVSYFFRPLGALLDNVANGWRYKPVDWKDITQRGLINSVQQQQQQQQHPDLTQQPWMPLVWGGSGEEVPLVSVELLHPPKTIPVVQPAPGGACGAWALHGSSTSSNCMKVPRRRRIRQMHHPTRQQFVPVYLGPGGQQAVYAQHAAAAPLAGVQASLAVLGLGCNEQGWHAAASAPPGTTGPVLCVGSPATSHYAQQLQSTQAGGQGSLQWQGLPQAPGFGALPAWGGADNFMLAPVGQHGTAPSFSEQQQQQPGTAWVVQQQLQGSPQHPGYQMVISGPSPAAQVDSNTGMAAAVLHPPLQSGQPSGAAMDTSFLLQLLLQQQQQQQQPQQVQQTQPGNTLQLQFEPPHTMMLAGAGLASHFTMQQLLSHCHLASTLPAGPGS